MGSASLGSSIVNLVKSTLGAGVLSVPFAFGQTGWLFGVVVICLCGAIQAFALHLLALSVLQASSQSQEVSFNSLARTAFTGNQAANAFVSLSVIALTFGTSVAYFIIIGDLIPEVFEYLGVRTSPWNSRSFWMSLIGWCIELPLVSLSKLDSLKFSSVIGTFGLVYIVIVICLFAAGTIDVTPPEQDVSLFAPPGSEYTTPAGMFGAVSICICAFGCAANIPAAVVELRQNTLRRVNTMIVSVTMICATILAIVGVFGSRVFGASVEGNSLKSFPNEPNTAGGLVSVFARVAVVINVMGSIPLRLHPLRSVISEIVFGVAPSNLSRLVYATLTIVLFFLAWCSALLLTNLDDVLALVGSTSDVAVGFTLPALFYWVGVRQVSDESPGICLQDQSDRNLAAGDAGGVQFRYGHAPLKKSALVLTVASFMMMPVLLGGEIYKMANEE